MPFGLKRTNCRTLFITSCPHSRTLFDSNVCSLFGKFLAFNFSFRYECHNSGSECAYSWEVSLGMRTHGPWSPFFFHPPLLFFQSWHSVSRPVRMYEMIGSTFSVSMFARLPTFKPLRLGLLTPAKRGNFSKLFSTSSLIQRFFVFCFFVRKEGEREGE